MILIIGGKGSGKIDYVLSRGYNMEDISTNISDDRPVLRDLQELVFAAPDKAADMLPALLQKEVVICDEVGSGVIPIQKQIREGREATGRLCILLAQEAQQVIRMVCGIPQVIK